MSDCEGNTDGSGRQLARDLASVRRLKLELMARGLVIGPTARDRLTAGKRHPLVARDYATTGGLTLVLPGNVYVNAPIDEWFCDDPTGRLEVGPDGSFALVAGEEAFEVTPVPLPGYLSGDRAAPSRVMTHADRIRLSPVTGCSLSCRFCDWHLKPYDRVPIPALREGLRIALADVELPARHILISGGTPLPGHLSWFEDVVRDTVDMSALPVDVMFMPRGDASMVDRLVACGACGFAINVELFDPKIAERVCPGKHRVGHDGYAALLSRAVELTGGGGRVRSLLLVGVEPIERTLEGVEFLAALGVDPVLSPFRPAAGTALAEVRPPEVSLMAELFVAATEIAERHGVRLGPRCIPCMHNTITFPDASESETSSGS